MPSIGIFIPGQHLYPKDKHAVAKNAVGIFIQGTFSLFYSVMQFYFNI